MKEIIKKKMDEHIDRILAKEEITNEDYYILSILFNRLESKEKAAEMAAKMETENEERKQKQKELFGELAQKLCTSFD